MNKRLLFFLTVAAACIAAFLIWHPAALSCARPGGLSPFSMGITEGGGSPFGFTGWILRKQSEYNLQIAAAVRATQTSPAALWLLLAVCFAYGVFHAAGPGHGKAVVASYMLANEQALKRGIVIAAIASALQAMVAVAIIGIAAIGFHATAPIMTCATNKVELISYGGIAMLGTWLIWTKGEAFFRALQGLVAIRALPALSFAAGYYAAPPSADLTCFDPHGLGYGAIHIHDETCGHYHAPDPRTLGDDFSWKSALLTVFAAGSRPCSGAILVLVFALAQGVFWVGVTAAFAMAVGTAITTSALASVAVLARGVALRLTGAQSRKGEVALRGLEVVAAVFIFLFGTGLLFGLIQYGA
ncbi:nickel/cobalt transporter [Methylovirgula sp. 4M-Z18]|uniref:nickel/cobalt transporter n=1 Tax=Methylovirgula sp. 4M-Z18 TaxID=2293567 RepID=UPI001FE23BD5|nr:nickel/cobalt transporter [Methylovirgula sp. 4M-Z18]